MDLFLKWGGPEAVCSQKKECDDPTDGGGDIPSMRLSQTFDSVVSAGVREPRVC